MTNLARDEQLVLRAVYELKKQPELSSAGLASEAIAPYAGLDEETTVEVLQLLLDSGHLQEFELALNQVWPVIALVTPAGLRVARNLPTVEEFRSVQAQPGDAGDDGLTQDPVMRRTSGTPTWAVRDLPVLVAAVTALDSAAPAPWVHSMHLARSLSMEQPVVDSALRALERTGYLDLQYNSEGIAVVGATRARMRRRACTRHRRKLQSDS